MTFLGSATNEGVKNLGPGAFLVSVLPGAVLVLVVFALVAADLYPWQHSPDRQHETDGFRALTEAGKALNLGGAVALVLGVLIVAVLLRPFQIAAVQFLEGYWTSRRWAFAQAVAVERQVRYRSLAIWRSQPRAYDHRNRRSRSFGEIAAHAQREARRERGVNTAVEVVASFPHDPRHVLPTRLGNVLRRAETTAGERYGLDTVTTYPHLHSNLDERFEQDITTQLNLLDVSAALTLVMSALALVSAPLIARPGPDVWQLLPLVFLFGAAVSYRGARRAAALYGDLLLAAYDLHRFDMLRALHRPLPASPKAELRANAALTRFLVGDDPLDPPPGSRLVGRYEHPPHPDEAPKPGTTTT